MEATTKERPYRFVRFDGDLAVHSDATEDFSADWDDEGTTRADALASMGVTEFEGSVL